MPLYIADEDLSNLQAPGEPATNLRYIYEPMAKLVTDEWICPYCWGAGRISFFPHYDHSGPHKVDETEHCWRPGSTVTSDGETFRLLSATCVYRMDQRCMRWLAKRGP